VTLDLSLFFSSIQVLAVDAVAAFVLDRILLFIAGEGSLRVKI
jgi:hypothetical protein